MTEGQQGQGSGGDNKPWFDGFDAETKGYLQTRTWDKKTPAEAFLEASKAHREAEKFVGAPADKLIRIPDERTTDTPETRERHAQEWKNIFERLGKPKEAKEYDFSSVKNSKGEALDQETQDFLRQQAFDANMTKDAALKYAIAFVKRQDEKFAADAALAEDRLNTQKKELEKNWGANYAANLVVAKAAIKAFGLDPVVIAEMETGKFTGVGYSKVMEFFRSIGERIGEGRYVSSGGNSGAGVMTRDQAAAEKQALMRDNAWADRYLKGGVEEVRKMEALNRIITGTTDI